MASEVYTRQGIKGRGGPGLWSLEYLKTRLKALDGGAAVAVPEGGNEVAKVAQVGSRSDTCQHDGSCWKEGSSAGCKFTHHHRRPPIQPLSSCIEAALHRLPRPYRLPAGQAQPCACAVAGRKTFTATAYRVRF